MTITQSGEQKVSRKERLAKCLLIIYVAVKAFCTILYTSTLSTEKERKSER